MRRIGVACALIAMLLGAGQAKKDEVNDPADALQGGWSMVLLFMNGEEVPSEQAKSGELVVIDDEYRPKLGATADVTTFKIDATQSPKAIDFTFTSGFSKGKTVKGIYKIDGDDLTICRGLNPEKDRPTEFAAPTGSELELAVWKRSKTVGAKRLKALRDELKLFEATWKFVTIDAEGRPVPPELFKDDRLILKGKRFTSTVHGNTTEGVFKIDPTASPKSIDITFTDGPGKDNSQKGIYELDGDTQKICWSAPGKPRPTEFEAKARSGRILQVLEKVKSADGTAR
jgi:uncharacterized protein (TIGR03067 family)